MAAKAGKAFERQPKVPAKEVRRELLSGTVEVIRVHPDHDNPDVLQREKNKRLGIKPA